MGKAREIPFSEVRQRLTAIVDEVEKTGGSVKILRHGKAVAVLIGVQEYRAKLERKPVWTLAGSLTAVPGVDIEASLRDLSQRRIRDRKRRTRPGARTF
jgi:prevent-host-death family protein